MNDAPRSFTPDDSDEDMRAFLEDAGYLHIQGLFSEERCGGSASNELAIPDHYNVLHCFSLGNIY